MRQSFTLRQRIAVMVLAILALTVLGCTLWIRHDLSRVSLSDDAPQELPLVSATEEVSEDTIASKGQTKSRAKGKRDKDKKGASKGAGKRKKGGGAVPVEDASRDDPTEISTK